METFVSDLKHLETKQEVLQICIPLSMIDVDLFAKFNSARMARYGNDGVIHCFCGPIYRQLSPIKKFYYLNVTCKDDDVLLLINDLNYGSVRYLTLYLLPISLNGNRLNEEEVFDELVSNKIIGSVVFSDLDKQFFEVRKIRFNIKDSQTEFYTLVDERFEEINNNKFKSQYGINQAEKGQQFVFKGSNGVVNGSDFNAIEILLHEFFSYCDEVKVHVHDKSSYKNMIEYLRLYNNSEKVFSHFYYYNNILLSAKIFIRNWGVNDNYYASFTKNIFHSTNEQIPLLPNNLKNRLSKHSLFFSLRDLKERGVKIVQNGNCGENPGLKNYKLWENKHFIQYYVGYPTDEPMKK